MATVDEIEGVRPDIYGDTGSCSRQEMRKYAVVLEVVQPGACRKKGRASHPLRTFLSKHRDVRCEASTTTETAGGMHRQHQRRALQTSDAAARSQEGASCKALSRHEGGERWWEGLARGFRCVRNTNLLPPQNCEMAL